MCLAVPGKIIGIKDEIATIDYDVEKRKGRIIDKGFKTGDYVIVQGGIVMQKVRSKEASLKFSIGRENMNDSEVIENIIVTYNTILKSLSKGRDNIRNVKIKFTMSHPVKINIDSLSNINK